MIGKTLGHYHITGLLGKGGMGEVYRARDTKLDRDVAIKVLPSDVANDPTRLERFRREARTVAGLNHPNIVMLFSVEEADGVNFLTMELIEGRGLDEIITPDGLPLEDVIDIGMAIADALAAAHANGIVHRDLKPANVRLTKDGRVKVLDFGLAKLMEKAPASESAPTRIAPMTNEGTVLGTVPYMSPEQLRGLAVDDRSDVFSLGVLLYEMAAGKRPFTGATITDVMTAIMRDAPTPLAQVKRGIPPQFERMVVRCLEKDPANRYQSANDVRDDARALQSATALVPIKAGRSPVMIVVIAVGLVVSGLALFKSMHRGHPGTQPPTTAKTIAVLPFVNMSGDPNQEYFSDGISEELLNLLAKVPQLEVAARTSSFSFKGQRVEVPEIGKKLGVEYVLEGSVRRDRDKVRITAQLVHATDGFHVWSDTYDRKLDDIFAIQDEISADVVKKLQVKLLGAAPVTRKTSPGAYGLYLEANALARLGTTHAFQASDSLAHRALEIDSTYAPSWFLLATNETNRATAGLTDYEQGLIRARKLFEHTLAIDPQFAGAYAGLGTVAMNTNDLTGAAAELERALALDPSDSRVLNASATLLVTLGRQDEAVPLAEILGARDPLNPVARLTEGFVYMRSGQLDRAITTFRALLSLSPTRTNAHYLESVTLLQKGDARGALAAINQESSEALRMIGLPMVYHALGRKADSDRDLADLIAKYAVEADYNIAYVYAFRGESDKAFEWLEKASKTPGSCSEIVAERFFSNIHHDPRWVPFLRKVDMAPEQLARIKFSVPPLPASNPGT